MKIYVGNLPYSATDESLKELFSPFGTIVTASVIMDRYSGQSKGFGFIEMATDSEANAAIAALNETPLDGRNIRVNEARVRDQRDSEL